MTADEARGALWSELVDGLLDARTDPATARFDAELAAAVDAGELSRRAAQRLRFWQRAAVNGVDDHVRTVVPAVLGALDAARTAAQAYVDQSGATLRAGQPDGPDLPAPEAAPDIDAVRPVEDFHPLTAPDLWRGGRPTSGPAYDLAPSARPEPVPGRPPTAAQQAEPPDVDLDDARRASTSAGQRPSTLEGPPPRLFVADLRDVVP